MQNSGEVAASVIIPSYNAKNSICNCINSILAQEVDFAFEIIVVDSSGDDTAAILKEHYPQVRVIRSEKRLYPGEARNIGIQHASGSIIAFIDADCVACDQWLETIRRKHVSGYAAIGGAIINGNPASALGWAEYFMEFTEFLPSSPPREVRTIPTCNITYKKKEVFDRYGFFPSTRTAEDTVFNWMLVKNGQKILFDPSIRIVHICDKDFRQFLRNQRILGAGFAESRSHTSMPGSTAAKYLWPLLPFAKLLLIAERVVIWAPRMIFDLVRGFPLLVVGLAAWQYGFVRARCFGLRAADCLA